MNFRSIFALALGLVAVASGCRKLSEPEPGLGEYPVRNEIKATISGKVWTSNATSAMITQTDMTISATTSDSRSIKLKLKGILPGTYMLGGTSENIAEYVRDEFANALFTTKDYANAGVVTIDHIDEKKKEITGSFYFVAKNPHSGDTVGIHKGSITRVTYIKTGDNSTKPPFIERFDAFVDDVEWVSETRLAAKSGGSINISASVAGGSTMGLKLPETITMGTYALSSLGDYTAYYNPAVDTFMVSTGGAVTIVEHNTTEKIIKGSFNFQAENLTTPSPMKTVTEGFFNMKYQ